jgi:hypothetical protein
MAIMGWKDTIVTKKKSWKDTISEDGYESDGPKERSKTLPALAEQKAAASVMLDSLKVAGQGASQGFSDEIIAGMKTGSLSSPEYINERNVLRNEMEKSRQNVGLFSPVVEAAGSIIPTVGAGLVSAPIKAAPFLTEMTAAGIQGIGEAPETADIPESMGWSMGIQAGSEALGKGIKSAFFEDPTKILSKSVGAKAAQVKVPGERSIQSSVARLDNAGFFKQGAATVDTTKQAWKRSATNLKELFQPQNLDSLYKRTTDSMSLLKETNNKLIANKKIPYKDFEKTLNDGVADLSYDPEGFNLDQRENLANGVREIIVNDLAKLGRLPQPGSGGITAEAVEASKKSLDKHVGSPAFKKAAEDLGINPEAIVKFRQKLDELVDKIGGPVYKKNNDLMSDLYNVKDAIETKLNREYIDTGSGLVDNRDWKTKILEGISPTPVDIVRSDIARGGPVLDAMGRVIKRTPTEMLTEEKAGYEVQPKGYSFGTSKQAFPFGVSPEQQVKNLPGRNPNSVGISPMEMTAYRIPRTTQGIMQNKDKVLGKLIQNGVDNDTIDTIAHALDNDPESIPNIVPLILAKFPTIFERSKYQVFDGIISGPDRPKAADAISKREDLNSIQRAKAIDGINKSGKMPEELK